MLRAGIHAEQNTPTHPGSGQGEQGAEHYTPQPSALTALSKTLASKVCSECRAVFICAGKGRTAALGNAVLLQLARGCSPASCP